MRFVIQRVNEASVTVNEEIIGSIQKGYMVLIGISDTDTKETADKLVRKMINLRIFEDDNGKTNLSLSDVKGSLLLISQIVKKVIVQVLQRRDVLKKQKSYISILLKNVKRKFRLSKPEVLALRCM